MIVYTERLSLRPTNIEDGEFILKLLNTPKWIDYIGQRHVHTQEQAVDYIKDRMLPQLERLGYSNFTIVRLEDGAKVGCCGLYDREGIEGVDLGFALLPQYESNGYGYESAMKILELAKTRWSINKVSAITTIKNKSSQKLLIKLGLEFIKHIVLNKEELMLYEMKLSEKTSFS